MTKQIIITVLTAIVLIGCKTETKKTEVTETIVEAQKEAKTETSSDYQVGSQVPKDLVCMVNNAYMGKPQIPVPVNGKTYYGCCEMCVGALNNNETARTATDPFSGRLVDKTEAYIVLIKKEGDVAYFESKENYENYLQ
jgi:YHS domain-containing protein